MRHIKYRATALLDGSGMIEVEILEQTHRGIKFGPSGSRYFVFGGVVLRSYGRPYYMIRSSDNMVNVLGRYRYRDREKIVMPLDIYNKFKEAVIAYNKRYSK